MPNLAEWAFLVSLIALLFIPRRKKILWITIFVLVVTINIGIRVFFIQQSHQLKEQVTSLDGVLTGNKEHVGKLQNQLKEQKEQVGSLQSEIDEFIIQREDYQQQVDSLQSELAETKKLAEPNTIELASKSFVKTDEGYSLKMGFKPMKNEPLGIIVFVVLLPKDSKEKIINFWPDGTFSSGADSKKIDKSGLVARLEYGLMGGGGPWVTLTVSGPTQFRLKGNFLPQPIVFEPSEFK